MFKLQPESYPKSNSPGGGRGSGLPEWDKAYLAFCRSFIEEQNLIWLDRNTKFGFDLPRYEPIDIVQFNIWMYEKTHGDCRNPVELVNYIHKIRHLAMELRDDPENVMIQAKAFIDDAYNYKD